MSQTDDKNQTTIGTQEPTMTAPSRTKTILRGIFSWKMLFMLIGSVVIFGGVFYKIFSASPPCRKPWRICRCRSSM